MLDPRLILVGTVHGDPRGYERALRLLEYFRPDLITVEISPFSVRYRAARQEHWRQVLEAALVQLPPEARRHPAIRRVALQIQMPFEWRAAHDYGRRAGIRWQAIDLSGVARRHLPLYEKELLSPENLKQLWETPEDSWEEQVAAAYRRARRSELRPLPRLPGRYDGIWRPRERTMAARLRRLAGRSRRVIHLGGWEHVASWEDGSGLYEILYDLKPFRVFLDEADRLSEPKFDAQSANPKAKGAAGRARRPAPPQEARSTWLKACNGEPV